MSVKTEVDRQIAAMAPRKPTRIYLGRPKYQAFAREIDAPMAFADEERPQGFCYQGIPVEEVRDDPDRCLVD